MTMPAGSYYIGDLCYVMRDEWDEFCSLTIDGNHCKDGEFTLADGRRFASYGTMYGDGCYRASNGAKLGVDAGLIGCIKVDDIRDMSLADIESMGTIVEFEYDFGTGEDNGVINFGRVSVNTGYDEEDEDYEEDYNEDEE